VKLPSRSVERFLRQPDPAITAVLLYGPDAGLVRERADRLSLATAGDLSDPFRVTELTLAALRDEPSRLLDEANALSLAGGRRVVRLRDAGDSLAPRLAALLEAGATAALVVVEAGDLPAKSALRKLFDAAAHAASLGCYPDEGDALGQFIAAELKSQGLTLSRDALAYLVAQLGENRAMTRAELDKLALYAGRRTTPLELADAIACVGDGAGRAVDEVALAAADGDQGSLDRTLAHEFAAGASPITVLRAVGRHLQRLHLVAGLMQTGASAERALAALRPPPFGPSRDRFARQATRWSAADLAAVLDRLLAAEIACKRTGAPAEAICWRALVDIAGRARRSERQRAG
jgi:DNA polymerase III subunit delta